MATDYTVNYEDERFAKVDADHEQRVNDVESTYASIVGNTDQYYQAQIDATKEWEAKQSQLQQEQTDFTIEQIEQQKEQSRKDYLKEQSASYVDWRKQSNQYGTEAEKMASSGLMGTGFSESSQVSMYNTYQNRVATAIESYNQAVLNYNNAIKEARLQNNSALAEIAYQSLQTQLQLSLEGFQYENDLVLQLADKKLQLQQMRDNNWYKVLDQINTENALAEDVRQFNENIKFQTEQAELDRNFQAQQAELDRKFKEAQEALNRQHDFDLLDAKTEDEKELLDKQHEQDLAKLEQQLANEKALLKYQYDLQNQNKSTTINKGSTGKATTYSGGGSKSGSGIGKQANIVSKYDKPVNKSFTGSTYEQAVSFLKSIGWNRASGIMTMNEWSRRKNAGSTAAEVKNYSTYQAYLKGYCAYAVQQTYG